MRTSGVLLFFVAVASAASTAACGGRVEDPAPPNTSGSSRPTNAPTPTGCAGTCDYVASCTTPYETREDCIPNCERDFPEPSRADRYESCIRAQSCDEIERSLYADYGVFGYCMSVARRP